MEEVFGGLNWRITTIVEGGGLKSGIPLVMQVSWSGWLPLNSRISIAKEKETKDIGKAIKCSTKEFLYTILLYRAKDS